MSKKIEKAVCAKIIFAIARGGNITPNKAKILYEETFLCLFGPKKDPRFKDTVDGRRAAEYYKVGARRCS